MKLPNKKELLIFGLLIMASVVLFCAGISERVHPDEFLIEFTTLLTQPDQITCGPTCATMILHHYDKVPTIAEVESHTKTVWFTNNTQDVGMTSPDYLAIAMQDFGLSATMKYGNLDVLKHNIAQGKPCIALVRSGERMWHYVVVRGFTKDKILIANPSNGQLCEIEAKNFEGCWSWKTDMNGAVCKNTYLCTILRAMEVYPYTFICPDKLKE